MDVIVDWRKHAPSVRDQCDRQTCLAFAVSAAHSIHLGFSDWLSVEYLFYYSVQQEPGKDPTKGIGFRSVIRALRHDGQPQEEKWPYRPKQVDPLPLPPRFDPNWCSDSQHSGNASDVSRLFSTTKSHPVIIGVRLTDGFDERPHSPFLINDGDLGFGGHALLALGVGSDESGDEWILARNSWGTNWGDMGDAWLAAKFLNTNLLGFIELA